MIDLVGGQLQIMFDPLQSVMSMCRAASCARIAVSSEARSPVLPNVPTIAESGYPGFETTAWWGVFAPAKLPPDWLKSLWPESNVSSRSETFREQARTAGCAPDCLDWPGFRRLPAPRSVKWGKAVRDSGATAE